MDHLHQITVTAAQKLRQKQDCEVKSKANVLYSPLIDKKLSDPTTILTAMDAVEKATKKAGQEITILTCDPQLYRVVLTYCGLILSDGHNSSFVLEECKCS